MLQGARAFGVFHPNAHCGERGSCVFWISSPKRIRSGGSEREGLVYGGIAEKALPSSSVSFIKSDEAMFCS